MRANNALDFDNLLALATTLLRSCPEALRRYRSFWQHVMVDEFQDTNAVQYEFVRVLLRTGPLWAFSRPNSLPAAPSPIHFSTSMESQRLLCLLLICSPLAASPE